MNITKQISKNLIYIYRILQDNKNHIDVNQTASDDLHQKQLRDLYIYIAVLFVIILGILGGYALYKKCVEQRALEEIEREYELMIMNLINSFSSDSSSSQENKRPHSYNSINHNQNLNNIYLENNIDSQNNNNNNSFDNNHEERMESIRKKFGNSVVIKCLLKKQIEEIKYTKNFSVEYGDNCTICMENFVEFEVISRTPCEHIFHKKCFDKYLKGIKGKDKLLCPNCNQNLLINKKFLKLRVKAKRIEVKKDTNKLKDIKESELNLESRNRNSIMTNKNEEYIPKNNNEVIFIKKKIIRTEKNKNKNPNNIHSLKEKNVFCNSNSNTVKGHKQLQITVKKNKDNKTEKETVLSDDKRDNEDKAIERNRKRNIVFMNNNDKKNSTLKSSMNSNEQKTKFKNKIINLGDVSSERDIIVNRKTYAPIISTIKKDK
jgi:hypothetical protein